MKYLVRNCRFLGNLMVFPQNHQRRAGSALQIRSLFMMNNLHPIRDYIVPGKRAHLVGIGGVSMCPLAEVLRGMGLHVQGSDMTESDTVRHLRSLGIPVALGPHPRKPGGG